MLLPIVLIAVTIGLIILGVKGFTSDGIPVTKSVTLSGTSGKITGVLCILGGILLIPAFLLVFFVFR